VSECLGPVASVLITSMSKLHFSTYLYCLFSVLLQISHQSAGCVMF